ncbi:MAG: RloB family protein [Phycisphaerae bacterium]
MKRINRQQNFRAPILIVCEGYLEYYYFWYLYNLYQSRGGANDLKFTITCADGGSPLRAVEKACVEGPREYRERWCVIDVEYPESKMLSQAILLANSGKIKIALTNPSFDAWALAHRRRLTSNDGSEVRGFKDALALEVGQDFSTQCGTDFVATILGSECSNLARATDNISTCNDISDVRRQIPSTNVHLLARLLFPPRTSPSSGIASA